MTFVATRHFEPFFVEIGARSGRVHYTDSVAQCQRRADGNDADGLRLQVGLCQICNWRSPVFALFQTG
jgi:hypothetical protein